MKFKKLKVLFLLPLVLLITSSQKTDPDYFEISKNLKLVASVYEKINNYYVDEILPGRVMKKGIDAMLKSLDPYTVYISEAQIEDFRFTTTGEYGGIGASIKKRDKKTVVSELYENSPAEKSGLIPGDEIYTIDGIEISNKTLEEIGSLLKGPAESIIKIEIKRKAQTLEKLVKREKIQIPAVNFYKKINPTTGIIKLTSFTNTASNEFKKALSSLQKENINNLIIDLRANGGGLLNEAVKIVNFFIPKGQEVVSTKSRIKEMNRSYKTKAVPIAQELSLVVLVDEYSASASEIVAGAIQDNDRGIIIGRRSFGKGLVQEDQKLRDGSSVRITIARYYTPSGRCIQRPYSGDYDAYYEDLNRTEESMFTMDSSGFVDSLSFKTLAGRTVYGGGGISPDKFVPYDTSGSSYYLSALEWSGVFSQFTFDWAKKKHLFENMTWPSFNAFEKTFDGTILLKELREYVELEFNIIPLNENEFQYSKKRIIRRLKAEIARQFWSDDGFYKVYNQTDPEMNAALQSFFE